VCPKAVATAIKVWEKTISKILNAQEVSLIN
jgi:plasmid maintenance system antidote protein VapI